MRKIYESPCVVVELYELNDAIAAGCVTIYELYPTNPSDDSYTPTCYSDYESLSAAEAAAAITTPFMNDDCSCYYGSGNSPGLTS